MRQIVKEERLIESCEMVPSCAREFLQREGSSGRDVEIDRQLVEVLQMGSFADWNEGAISSCSDLHAFKLWPVEEKGDGVYRLLGSCFPTKEECKTFFKLFRDYPKKSYLIQGEWQGFWKVIDGEFVWFALGLQVFDAFIQVIKENLYVRIPSEIREKMVSLKLGFFDYHQEEIIHVNKQDPQGRIQLDISSVVYFQ